MLSITKKILTFNLPTPLRQYLKINIISRQLRTYNTTTLKIAIPHNKYGSFSYIAPLKWNLLPKYVTSNDFLLVLLKINKKVSCLRD